MTKFERYADPANLGSQEPEDIFSPHHYDSIRENGPLKRSLPLWCYTSEKFYKAEMDKIFLPSWTLLEREEIVPNVGDFHCITYLGVNLLIARGNDDKVRVFANTCRHRGASLIEGSGNCKKFRCPYHFWTYGLDGELIVAPDYTDAHGAALIDASNKEEFGLAEIESGTWGGFIFVRFKEGSGTLTQHLGSFVETLASHKLEDMRCARKVVYDMDANWKCFIENYVDLYHIPYVHKDSLARWKTTEYHQTKPHGHERIGFAVHEGSQLLLPGEDYVGFPAMPQIDADKKGGTFFSTLPPSFLMTISNDGALVFQSEPVSAGKSRLIVSSLFPKSYFERDDFEPLSENYYRRNSMVVIEDKDVTHRQYEGIQSPLARVARLCNDEARLNTFANWVLDQVIGADDKEAIAAE